MESDEVKTMNTVVVSGRLARNAVVFGAKGETLKFSIACKSGFDKATQESRVEFVPCVMFKTSEKLQQLLVAEGKGKPVELRGRIATSSYEKNGETRYATEVIADLRDFQLLRNGEGKTLGSRSGVSRPESIDQKGESRYASSIRDGEVARRDFFSP